MAVKIQVKNTDQSIELPRGSQAPREGEILILTLKGEREERLYSVYSVEHTYNFNMAVPIGQTLITVEEVRDLEVRDTKEAV